MISKQIAVTLALREARGEGDRLSQYRVFALSCSSSCTCPFLRTECCCSGAVALFYFEVGYMKTHNKKHFLWLLMLLKIGAYWKSLICILSPSRTLPLPALERDNETLLARLQTSCVSFGSAQHKQGREKSSHTIRTALVLCSLTAE